MRKKYFIITLIISLTLIIGGTFAWLSWQSEENTNFTLNIGEVAEVLFNGDNEIKATGIGPVISEEEGEITEFQILKKIDDPIVLQVSFNPSILPEGLKEESFKYKLYSKTAEKESYTLITEGNFKDKQEKIEFMITDELKVTSNTSYYRFIIYIDGNMLNPSTMKGQEFEGTILITSKSKCNAIDIEPNKPELADGMIPIRYDGTKWVKADQNSNTWYNYSNKEWANAVMVTTATRSSYMSASPNTEVKEDDVLAYYVWIPRYRYQLFNVESKTGFTYDIHPNCVTNAAVTEISAEVVTLLCAGQEVPGFGSIEQLVKQGFASWLEMVGMITNLVNENEEREICTEFENGIPIKKMGSTNGTYLTHPAFTFGDKELSGIWVGKFETSTDPNNTCYSNANATNCDNTNQSPRIKPNVKSLRYQKVSNQFMTSQKLGTLDYLTSTGTNQIDAHMMKNIEWGAVAYLKQSKYGLGLTDIGINNNSNYITGCGALSDSAESTTCDVYNTTGGILASTTGNITGVYDMSGGAVEYVMGVLVDDLGKPRSGGESTYNSGFNGTLNDGTTYNAGIPFPTDSKYYDLYKGTTINDRILGDATGETDSWYSDSSVFVDPSYPWFRRSFSFDAGNIGGVFSILPFDGSALSNESFRVVLAP